MLGSLSDGGDWRARAACLAADPDLFFPPGTGFPSQKQAAEAKAFCRGCSVVPDCLEEALVADEAHGVWGGMSPGERRRHRRAAGLSATRASRSA